MRLQLQLQPQPQRQLPYRSAMESTRWFIFRAEEVIEAKSSPLGPFLKILWNFV
jgi:hypothetical protein